MESDQSTATSTRPVREGLAHKRAAILSAARELFVRQGVERTSMDAVAAEAAVSKRTVYDYYGDKHGLLLAVVVAAGESLIATLQQALDEHLSDAADIRTTADLERALTDFAVSVGVSMLGSSDYTATVRLITENGALLPELASHPLNVAPEEAVAERLAHFASTGLLDAEDPRLAADHFNGLTTLLAFGHHQPGAIDADRVRQIMVDGVHAFMRAYGSR
ncbi:TetR/AcrR family transcriptional regulator [Nocardioides plantarum]|uniref:TetR/AcrR family transcriptional regulator n=1 Tax=Nocardioides plantarum TaxID=29299 RepID=A0ABV5K9H3_9ACTN|nr:TetR/AcrR family transcriptional regulator [Nocardioides plantarum]